MNADTENEAATVTCLAITAEKRSRQGQRRPASGCAGIFYQLFDWNRRVAKNSNKNKLNLPSSGTPKNSTSRRFGAHDPPPASKFHLIAEEKDGGFSNAKKHRMDIVPHKHEMRPSSLVAKLMGLDSMPTAKKVKHPRPSHSKSSLNKVDEKLLADVSSRGVEEEGLLKNNEPRPQKQQKTGQLDIHSVGRLGHDALQLKSVLSQSRKHLRNHKGSHLPKLPTPVKSPRVRSGKNAARLIDAATKILEPRLRACNIRANAITDPNFLQHEMNQQSVREAAIVKPPYLSSDSMHSSNLSDNLEMLSPCKNCGHFSGDSGIQQFAGEQLSPFQSNVSRYDYLSPQKWPCRPMIEDDNEKPYELDRNQLVFVEPQIQDCVRTHNEPEKGKRSPNSHDLKEWHFLSRPHETEVQLPTHSSVAFNHQQQKTNKMQFDGENLKSKSKPSSLQSQRVASAANGITKTKEMGRLSPRVNDQSRQRLLKKVNNVRFNPEMEQSTSKSQPKTPERKRRIINTTGKVENGPSSSSKLGITEFHRLPSCSPSSRSHLSSNSKFGVQRSRKICTEPLSFTFHSPAKCKSEISLSKDKIGSAAKRMDFANEKTVHPSPDVLDILLKQKLKELTFREQREQAGGGAQSETSRILQELISALATEHHTSNDLVDTKFSHKNKLYFHSVGSSPDAISHHHDISLYAVDAEKAKKMTEDPSIRCLCDSDHLSPGSVLGASFSNISCVSSSLDGHSDIILQNRLMEYAHYISPSSEPVAQVKQVTSTDKISTLGVFITSISIMLEKLMQHGATLTAYKFSHIKEVVLHAGLVLENGSLTNSEGKEELFICHFFNQLETFADAMWSNSKDPPGFKEGKDKTQLKGILLNLAVEYLDLRFGINSNIEFDLGTRLPLKLTAQQLIIGLNNKIIQWADLAGKTPDELIVWELCHSSGHWDDFEIEASCVCYEFDEEVLKTLVEEIVMDFYQNNRCRTKWVSTPLCDIF